jgi:hypothetical protein
MRKRWALIAVSMLLLVTVISLVPAVASGTILGRDDVLKRINFYRQMEGTVSLNTALNNSAQTHAQYCKVEGYLTHYETKPTNPYYRGYSAQDRAHSAGYPDFDPATGDNLVSEDGLAGRHGPAAVDTWMDSVYHRWIIINPDARDIGYGEDGFSFLEVGFGAYSLYQPVCYPLAGQMYVPTTFNAASEFPNPIAPDPEGGYPVTVSLPSCSTVTLDPLSPYSLKIHNGATWDDVLFYPLFYPGDIYYGNNVALVAKDALIPGKEYQAHIAGTVVGVYPLSGSYTFNKTWTFTTCPLTKLTISSTETSVVINFINGGSSYIQLPNYPPIVIKDSHGCEVYPGTSLPMITTVDPWSCQTWHWTRTGVPSGTYTAELRTLEPRLYTATFTLSQLLPPYPANGEIVYSLTPRLEWEPSMGASSYGLQVATDPSFGNLVANEAGITNPFFDIPTGKLNWNSDYYWRINASDSQGNTSDWSSPWSFYTVLEPSPSPTPNLEIGGEVYPLNKSGIVAFLAILSVIIIAVSIVIVRKRVHNFR